MAQKPSMPRGTAAEHVKQALADALILGQFRPGDRLDEQALATQYGVSRTPVREALRHLAVSGLVELRPNRGAIVRELASAEAADLFEAAAEMDALCARLAAERMTAIERNALEMLVADGAQAVTAGAATRFRVTNGAFHEAIYRGAHNALLAETARVLLLRSEPYRSAQFSALTATGRLAQSQAEHEAILNLILAKDGPGAQALMARHIAFSGALIMSQMAVSANAPLQSLIGNE
ncbi:GntR family transcriptional regulator [uncultured Devosia sp.]|uniref:GntR family transcriptional regulator n=1 Tax=uncultured Devosia sp. TaxID=211434 RepID=UPI0035CA621C